MPAGPGYLVVQHSDWQIAIDGPFQVPDSGAVPDRRIRLEAGGRIEGTVVDPQGNAIPEQCVYLAPLEETGVAPVLRMVWSDSEGRFAITGVSPARYVIDVHFPGPDAAAHATQVTVVKNDVVRVRLKYSDRGDD